MNDLLVKHDDNAVFADYSKQAREFLRDSFQTVFVSAEDKLYFGLYKPFSDVYVEIDVTDSLADLTFWINGTQIEVQDDTDSFKRSGFIKFDKPIAWASETFDGVSGYWLEIQSSTDFDVTFNGINLVFSDDLDLQQESRNIMNLLYKNDSSFIAYHVASRNDIIQTLRNGGYSKKVDDIVKNITKWDILDLGEIRQAAKYLTLSKIYFDTSKNIDDKHYRKYQDYEGYYGSSFKLFTMKLDKNDDGEYDQQTELEDGSIEVYKV